MATATATAQDKQAQQATYVTLIGLFLALFGAFFKRESDTGDDAKIQPFDFLLLSFATYRAGRLTAYDKVTAPIRSPFTETKPDDTGAGDTVVPKGTGPQKALGELLACPTCVGTWAAAFMVYGLRLAPRPTRILLAILSATGLAELINSSVEVLTWSGRAARKQAGS